MAALSHEYLLEWIALVWCSPIWWLRTSEKCAIGGERQTYGTHGDMGAEWAFESSRLQRDTSRYEEVRILP